MKASPAVIEFREACRSMPTLLLKSFLVCFLMTTSVVWSQQQIGERTSVEDDTRGQVMDRLGDHLKTVYERRQTQMQNPSDLLDKFADAQDSRVYQSIFEKAKSPKLFIKSAIHDEHLIAKIGNVTLKSPLINMFEPHLLINNRPVFIQPNESYRSYIARVEQELERELKRRPAKTVWSNWPMAQAFAQSENERARFKDLLLINSTGMLYLTVTGMEYWQEDASDTRQLLTFVQRDLRSTQKSCEQLSENVGISDGDVPVYKMLNHATARTLEQLAVNNQIDSRLLLRNAFARYATRSEHNVQALGFTSCEGFMESFLNKVMEGLGPQVVQLCEQFRQTQTCLSHLKANHDRVQNRGRDAALKLYNGRRLHADRNENALPLVSNPASTR